MKWLMTFNASVGPVLSGIFLAHGTIALPICLAMGVAFGLVGFWIGVKTERLG